MNDAEPADIYVDKQGKLWRCVAICHEPTVTFEAVEGYVPSSHPAIHGAAQAMVSYPQTPQIVKPQHSGGVNSLMFQGWKRIWRKDDNPAPIAQNGLCSLQDAAG